MQQIGQGVFYEDFYLGVTLGALTFPHGIIMIDAPLRVEDARSWRSALINQRGGPNRLLVCLDEHPDRMLGLRTLESTIVTHQHIAHIFRNRPTIFKGQNAERGAVWETYGDAIGMRWAAPDITFTERMSLHWGGPEIVLEHHPGPTPGSIWVIIPELKIVFVGDMVLLDQPPFLADADLGAWLDGLAVLSDSYSDYMIISGRGGATTMDAVKAQAKFLRNVKEQLEQLASRSVSPEATDALLIPLLRNFSFADEWRELYMQRLQYGLYQCYARIYQSRNSSVISDDEI